MAGISEIIDSTQMPKLFWKGAPKYLDDLKNST